LQQAGPTKEQSAAGLYCASVCATGFKEISLKRYFFNKSNSVAGRTKCYFPHLLQSLDVACTIARL
jgi:hypothetical protein